MKGRSVQPDLPQIIEATLLRPRVLAADGTARIEVDDDPNTWRDGGDPDLVPMGKGVFSVILADDRATLAQIDGDTDSMAVRARFEPLADCPQPRMGDTLAVNLGPALAVAFEVAITGDDLASALSDWGTGASTPFLNDGPAPGELLLILREELGALIA